MITRKLLPEEAQLLSPNAGIHQSRSATSSKHVFSRDHSPHVLLTQPTQEKSLQSASLVDAFIKGLSVNGPEHRKRG